VRARNDNLTEEDWEALGHLNRLSDADRHAVYRLVELYPLEKALSLIESSAEGER
jgi:hypothetical protein